MQCFGLSLKFFDAVTDICKKAKQNKCNETRVCTIEESFSMMWYGCLQQMCHVLLTVTLFLT